MPQLPADTLPLFTDPILGPVTVGQPPISLFETHELLPKNDFSIMERGVSDSGFVFFILLLCVSIVAYLQLNSDRLFPSIFKASFDRNLASQEARIENSQRVRNLFVLKVVAFLSISLFLTAIVSKVLLINAAYSSIFIKVLGALTVFFLLKRSIFWLLAQLFEMASLVRPYQYDLTLFISSLGILLLPVTLTFFYAPVLPPLAPLYIGLGAIGFFYLKGVYRGLTLAMGTASVSPLHLFYYFCALEILPIFILVRFVQML